MSRRCPISSQYIKLPVEDGGAPGSVDSFNGRTGIVVSQNGDYTASQITNVPHGSVSATNVQAAINELADESASSTLTNTHIYVGNVSNVATDVALSGDATLANTGALTLASTAVTTGSYGSATQVPNYTVDAKGRLTAAANTSIQIAESQVTNLVGDLAAKQSTTLTSAHILVGNVSNVATDVAMSGDVGISNTGATIIQVGAVTDTKASLATKPAVTVVATSNLTLSGAQTIDGQLTVAGQSIVLASAQSTGAENGPWVVQSGVWTRPTWYPSGGTTQAVQFSIYFVRLGTTYRGSTWRQTTASPITIDTTATAFSITPLAVNSSTLSGTVPLANGGTAATTAPAARVSLNIDGRTTFSNADYTALSSDRYVAQIGTMSAPRTVTLPAANSVNPGQMLRIVDESGTVTTTNLITVAAAGADTIDGAASKVIRAAYGEAELTSNGTDGWFRPVTGIGAGGTALTTTPTNGQLLIGNTTTSSYALGTITAGTGISITNAAGSITVTNGNNTTRSISSGSSISASDATIICDTSGGAFNLTLPSPSTVTGQKFLIIDKLGNFNTNNLTLVRAGSEKINGLQASRVLTAQWGFYWITTDGTDWWLN